MGRPKGPRTDGEEKLEGFQEKWGKIWGCLGHQAFLVESPKFWVEPEKNGYNGTIEGFLGKSGRAAWVQQKEGDYQESGIQGHYAERQG